MAEEKLKRREKFEREQMTFTIDSPVAAKFDAYVTEIGWEKGEVGQEALVRLMALDKDFERDYASGKIKPATDKGRSRAAVEYGPNNVATHGRATTQPVDAKPKTDAKTA